MEKEFDKDELLEAKERIEKYKELMDKINDCLKLEGDYGTRSYVS